MKNYYQHKFKLEPNISVDPSDNHTFWYTNEYMGNSTHGTQITSFEFSVLALPPVVNFSADIVNPNVGQTVSFFDTSINTPTSWSWIFSPSSVTFVGGTTATSQNPQVTFDTIGTYSVSLTASNAFGNDNEVKINYINTSACSNCYSWGDNDWDTSTTRVIFNTINKPSAKPLDGNGNAYSDYTNLSTDVLLGQTYSLSTSVNTSGNYQVLTKVWIDWNQDCDFDDAGEEYDLGDAEDVTDGDTSNSPLNITVPANAKIGNTTMRVSTKYTDPGQGQYSTSCLTDFDGEVEDYTINVVFACTGITTTWNVGTGWSHGTPDATTPVVINSNLDITSQLETCECEVKNGATLTVKANKYLLVESDILNNGTIVVEHEASLVQHDKDATLSGSGQYRIYKETTPYTEYDYTYWSSPVVGESIEDAFHPGGNTTVNGGTNSNGDNFCKPFYILTLNTPNYADLYNGNTFPQTTGIPDGVDDNTNEWNTNVTGTMMPGIGYAIMGAGADFPFNTDFATNLIQTTFFESTRINNGDIPVDVVMDGEILDNSINENFIGNPYASAIDLDLFKSDPDNTELNGTFHIWSHDSVIGSGTNQGAEAYNFSNLDYATYNAISLIGVAAHNTANTNTGATPIKYLASGQGFLAEITSAGTIIFKNSMRVTGNNDVFFSPNTIEKDAIWLKLTSEEGLYRQTAITFLEGASDTYDAYDSKRMESGINTDFYTIPLNSDENLVIQGLSVFNIDKTIKLGIIVLENGVYTIEIDKVTGIFNLDQDIFLEDTYASKTINLKNESLTFTATAQETALNDRFKLHFVTNGLSVMENSLLTNTAVYPNPSNGIFNISTKATGEINIEVYDILGKQIVNKINTTDRTINLSTHKQGFYFTKISQKGESILLKLIVK